MSAGAVLTRREATEAAPAWRYLLGRLHLSVDAGNFPAALDIVARVGRVATEHERHLDIDVRGSRVYLLVGGGDAGGVTSDDAALAGAIAQLLDRLGLVPQQQPLHDTEIAIDTIDMASIKPFWTAVLDYVPDGEDAIRDPDRRRPNVWFQQMSEPRPQRNRIHIDVIVAHDEAARRLDAVLAAGGRLVSDTHAPSFWVLADAEGNEACICTWQNPD